MNGIAQLYGNISITVERVSERERERERNGYSGYDEVQYDTVSPEGHSSNRNSFPLLSRGRRPGT